MIRKQWQISCNYCDKHYYYSGPIRNIKDRVKEKGWIISSDNEHYCDQGCYDLAKRDKGIINGANTNQSKNQH